MRILLADDDPTYRELISCLLAEWGFTAVTADNGQKAIELLQGDDPPKLAVLDWMMPEMDGFEVCRRIRQANGDCVPYVLLMTGQSNRDELVKLLVAGADDYIIKPFEPLDLKIRLRLAIRILDLQEQCKPPKGTAAR